MTQRMTSEEYRRMVVNNSTGSPSNSIDKEKIDMKSYKLSSDKKKIDFKQNKIKINIVNPGKKQK